MGYRSDTAAINLIFSPAPAQEHGSGVDKECGCLAFITMIAQICLREKLNDRKSHDSAKTDHQGIVNG
jgi:hypothetical protein